MNRWSFRAVCRRGGVGLMLASVLVLGGCSKEKEIKHLWEGPAVLKYAKTAPKARPASKTDFAKVKLREGRAKLTAPVDWKQNPTKSRMFRTRLHRWEWLWPLLRAFEESKDQESLKEATRLVLDWVEQNPLQGGDKSAGWDSANAAWRAQALGYLVRNATDADLLTGEQQDRLLTSVREHAAWLANDEHYDKRNGDSLYQDFGLAVMCANLDKLPDCKAWGGIARERFLDTANRLFDKESGVHLEHTPAYHDYRAHVVVNMAAVTKDTSIVELAKKVKNASAWMAPPDGYHLLVGEASRRPLSKSRLSKKLPEGLQLLGKSGYAVSRHKDSYLFAVAGFHSKQRKHQDELSFSWFEGGQRILADTGRADRSKPALLKFAKSAAAHNTLTVNGGDFALNSKPYGSAMLATGSEGAWQAMLGRNPTLSRVQTQHHRLWLYRPGELLLVIDRVQSPKQNRYDRYFHFWHELKVQLSDAGLATTKLKARELRAFDVSGDDKVEAKLLSDVKAPLQGVWFPSPRKPRPNYVLQLSTSGTDVVLGTLFEVGKAKLAPKDVSVDVVDDVFYVTLGSEKLGISQVKDKLKFELGVDKPKASKASDKDKAKKPAAETGGAAKAPAKAPAAPKPAAPKPAAPPKAQ